MFGTVHLLRLCVVTICYNSDVSCDPDSCLNVATFVEDLVAVSTLCCILLTNVLNHRFNLGRARQMVIRYILYVRIFFDYLLEGWQIMKQQYFLNGYFGGGERGKI